MMKTNDRTNKQPAHGTLSQRERRAELVSTFVAKLDMFERANAITPALAHNVTRVLEGHEATICGALRRGPRSAKGEP